MPVPAASDTLRAIALRSRVDGDAACKRSTSK